MHTNSDRQRDTIAPQRKHHHRHENARRKNHPRRPPAQEGRRNPAAAPPLSIRKVTSQQRAVSPRDCCRCKLHCDRRCYCEHALTPTQTNTNNLDCCANQIAVAGRPQPNHRKRIRTQARALSQFALAERILHIHFAQHDACPATESMPQIQDTPYNIAHYVTEFTRRSRRKICVFVDAYR